MWKLRNREAKRGAQDHTVRSTCSSSSVSYLEPEQVNPGHHTGRDSFFSQVVGNECTSDFSAWGLPHRSVLEPAPPTEVTQPSSMRCPEGESAQLGQQHPGKDSLSARRTPARPLVGLWPASRWLLLGRRECQSNRL